MDTTHQEIETIVDYLTYASYRANRTRSPQIDYRRWAAIYPDVEALEHHYQTEQEKTLPAAA